MQLSAPFLSLVATVIVALCGADARPLKAHRSASGIITFPVRRVDRNAHIHVELVTCNFLFYFLCLCIIYQRHQQHLNRAERLLARASGLPGPSDLQLRANLERRASYLSPVTKRFNIPSGDFTLPADGSDGIVSNVVTENDVYAPFSSSRPFSSMPFRTVHRTLLPSSPKIRLKSIPSRLLTIIFSIYFSERLDSGVDTSYVATVQLGTPARDFVIILDSGSGPRHRLLTQIQTLTELQVISGWNRTVAYHRPEVDVYVSLPYRQSGG